MIRTIVVFLSALLATECFAQQEIPLYAGKIPGSKTPADARDVVFNREEEGLAFNVSIPTLTPFLPPRDKANGTAVIICPGGGYHVLVIGREGRDVALEYNRLGIAAFVLKYRLPDERIMTDMSTAPLRDAQRAIQIVRQRAAEWNIDPHRIGIMGFSAGGHLASTAGTHFKEALIENREDISLRPDFMILVYPVISFSDSLTHFGSREYLLGSHPSEKQISYFSNELHTDQGTPHTFLILAGDDTVVNPGNSIAFYEALRRNRVAAEIHIYETGEHGFLKKPPFDEWFGRCTFWLKSDGWIY